MNCQVHSMTHENVPIILFKALWCQAQYFYHEDNFQTDILFSCQADVSATYDNCLHHGQENKRSEPYSHAAD